MSGSTFAHRLLVSVLALMLGGCGGGDASRGPTTTVSAPAQTEAQTSDDLDESEGDGGEDDGVGYGKERGKDHGKDKGKKLGLAKKD